MGWNKRWPLIIILKDLFAPRLDIQRIYIFSTIKIHDNEMLVGTPILLKVNLANIQLP
jgi:hypothetical protein